MAATERKFLDDAYELDDPAATRTLYRDWAGSYDEEVHSQGYVTPQRCARMLARHVTDRTLPVLDVGCGTGISGHALTAEGFLLIDGTDFSDEMLLRARDRGIYRRTFLHDLAHPLPVESGRIAHAVAAGALNPGHAPAGAIDHVLDILPDGGIFVFSLNDHALQDPTFEGRIHAHIDCGTAALLERAYGDHLPGIGLGAMVYALRRRA